MQVLKTYLFMWMMSKRVTMKVLNRYEGIKYYNIFLCKMPKQLQGV